MEINKSSSKWPYIALTEIRPQMLLVEKELS
jgi:hypothetical protein